MPGLRVKSVNEKSKCMQLFAGPVKFQFLCLLFFFYVPPKKWERKNKRWKKTRMEAWNKVREAGERHLSATFRARRRGRVEGELIGAVKFRDGGGGIKNNNKEGGDKPAATNTLKSVTFAPSLLLPPPLHHHKLPESKQTELDPYRRFREQIQ